MGMKKIGSLASSVLQNGQLSTESEQSGYGQSKKRMVSLWERMTHIYGHRWTASFGETAIDGNGELTDTAKTWASGLAELTGDQLAKGLRSCVSSEKDEWPSLPMFRKKCVGSDVNEFGLDYIPECYREKPVILDKSRLLSSDYREKKRKKWQGHIADLKKSLRGSIE